MRFFISIFSLYILILAIMPCTDAIACDKNSHNEHLPSSQHNHTEDETDTCSPFCVCACCGIAGFVFTSNKLVLIPFEKITAPLLASRFNTEFISSYYYTFWQPPKI